MPRLLINGFPDAQRACFHIRINGAAKGTGSQLNSIFDKTIKPTKDGIFELPLEKRYLGSLIRLEVNIPGYVIIDKNINMKSNIGFTSLKLVKMEHPDQQGLVDGYGNLDNWKNFDTVECLKQSKLQFKAMQMAQKTQDRNLFLGLLAVMLFFSALIYMIAGEVGILVVLIFGFYYFEKNKLNRWSDVT